MADCGCDVAKVNASAPSSRVRYLSAVDQYLTAWGLVTGVKAPTATFRLTSPTGAIFDAVLEEGYPGVLAGAKVDNVAFIAADLEATVDGTCYGYCYFYFEPTKQGVFEEEIKRASKGGYYGKPISDADARLYANALELRQAGFLNDGGFTSPTCALATIKALKKAGPSFVKLGIEGYLFVSVACRQVAWGIVQVVFSFKNVAGEVRTVAVAVPLRSLKEAAAPLRDSIELKDKRQIDGRAREISLSSAGAILPCVDEFVACLAQCSGHGAGALVCIEQCLRKLDACLGTNP